MPHAVVHGADTQDRDGGVMVTATLFGLYPFLRKLYADGGYQGPLFRAALGRILRNLQIDIAKRSDTASGFSRCCRSDGLWNEALPGLTAAVALRRIGKISISQR
jgi:hypothetical protein